MAGAADRGREVAGGNLLRRAADRGQPITLFAGSSVTHGYPWSQSQTFSRRYSEARGVDAVNASILALDVSGINDWIICAASRNQVRVATLVIEVPVVNTLSQLAAHHRASTAAPPLDSCAG